jgi:predicted O-linked N-acetylglucosamine transferase (SPINDLY family)
MSEVQTLLQSAIALHRSGRLAEAEAIYRRILAGDPNQPDALQLLGAIAHQLDQYGPSIELIRRSLALVPTGRQPLNNLGESLRATAQIDEAIATFRRAIELYPDYVKAHNNLLLTLHYQPQLDPLALRREHEQWAARHANVFPRQSPPARDRNPERPLRIGYVSPDFRRHSVGYFVEPVLERHDHAHFATYCYSNHAGGDDEIKRRLKQHADGWRDIAAMDDEAVAQLIREDQIDILVDLAGHMAGNRLLVFARQPAPLQATYLGYPNGLGLRQIGWRISDGVSDPPGMTETHYVQKIARLPGCAWCYRPPGNCPAVSERNADAPITFGSFNNFAKASPLALETWAAILAAVPGSRLLLKAKTLADDTARSIAMQKLQAAGIAAERVALSGWKGGVDEHLSMYGEVDVALDPFPYNGTTTTCEALWMGVPVVALAGNMHVSRVGASLLTAVGLTKLIAADTQQYIALATSLAGDASQRKELRRTLRQQMQASTLMDAAGFTRGLEVTYRQMWRDFARDVD